MCRSRQFWTETFTQTLKYHFIKRQENKGSITNEKIPIKELRYVCQPGDGTSIISCIEAQLDEWFAFWLLGTSSHLWCLPTARGNECPHPVVVVVVVLVV